METAQPSEATEQQAKWSPLSAIQRRVIGVLAEKAKTTPDAYPMTLNALTTGSNQKSNRHPQMELVPDDIEETLEELRLLGAVSQIQGGGRVTKYRHRLYDWLSVEAVELAVMTELLLRGPQSVGQLRGRAARMADIADLGTLRPVLDGLIAKGLVIPLSPEGRGQTVTHALLDEAELDDVRRQFGLSGSDAAAAPPATSSHVSPEQPPPADIVPDVTAQLRKEIADMRAEMANLRRDVEQLQAGLS